MLYIEGFFLFFCSKIKGEVSGSQGSSLQLSMLLLCSSDTIRLSFFPPVPTPKISLHHNQKTKQKQYLPKMHVTQISKHTIPPKDNRTKISLSQVLMYCPRATETLPCDKCKIDTDSDQTHPRLKCHCSHTITLHDSRSQNAMNHWGSGERAPFT